MMKCRFCGEPLKYLFISLGSAPLSNAYLTASELNCKERYFPLDVYVCDKCFLVQLDEYQSPEDIFSDYAYFSSYSDAWLRHSREYVEKMISLFSLGKNSHVIEVASNDGYLLQYFVQRGIPVLGIEPAKNVAAAARQKGIATETVFLGTETAKLLARERGCADLLLGNNVLAHVPKLNDFVDALKILLKPSGIITMEFPHLMKLIDNNQFDTIYHEHFSYFSFLTVEKIFTAHGLTIFDVEELPTHGGSLRIYVKHQENKQREVSLNVHDLKRREIEAGYASIDRYLNFKQRVEVIRREILAFLDSAKKAGKVVVGYGAPAKGNTLLNYCGIGTEFVRYVVDKNPHKQGRYLPGSRIPINAPDKIDETKPDYVLILPWNIKGEIMEQMSVIRKWDGKFVVPIPNVRVI